jgi:hypothetical protein
VVSFAKFSRDLLLVYLPEILFQFFDGHLHASGGFRVPCLSHQVPIFHDLHFELDTLVLVVVDRDATSFSNMTGERQNCFLQNWDLITDIYQP